MSETPWADNPIHKMIRDAGVNDGSSLADSPCSASEKAERLIFEYICCEPMEGCANGLWSLSEVHSILTKAFEQNEES